MQMDTRRNPAPQQKPALQPQPEPALERLDGTVERVTYHNVENGYSVLRMKARGWRELVTVLGYVSSVNPGESLEAFGEWVINKEYGRQFKAKSLRTVPPSTLEGMERYLGSGMVKGIGPHFARKMVKEFGLEVFNVIESDPHALRRIEGIGPKRIDRIISAWNDQKIVREIMVFLQSHGVSTSKAARIYKTYGADAIEKVKADPYQLARDIYGIGFKSADLVAMRLGISKNSAVRARAGVNYVLEQKAGEGHCAFPENKLIEEAAELLEVDAPVLMEAIEHELEQGRLLLETVRGEKCLYTVSMHRKENEVAALLQHLKFGQPSWVPGHALLGPAIDVEKALPWVEKKIGIELAPLQRDAVKLALTHKVSVITGGPGTGKSTLTRAILEILKAKNVRIALCSPTGRAAKRLGECTGMEAKTIHRLLGFDPKKGGFTHDGLDPLPADLVVVDEASMVDIPLAYSLLKAIPSTASLLIIGDVDQLPSVGPGRFLGDVIDSGAIPVVRLTEIFRQARESRIIQAAHRVNRGEFPEIDNREGSDFFFLSSDDPEKALGKVLELVEKRLPARFGFDPVKDIQVLCPMQRGVLGARNLNVELQKTLNPVSENAKATSSVERFGYRFAVGDKVMALVNDYEKEVFNGDMGYIRSLDVDEQECRIDFDGREVLFEFGEMDILQPAYAVTVHKSQGSEYPVIIVPVTTQHYMMLKRNLIYTGITRGKKLVILIGQKKALGMAIQAYSKDDRWTKLAERLRLA